ncbi:superfamily II DNA or RNA helicase/HKD family nuclease [Alkalibacillus filiformis]|uniref:Superfamily II DNA or RNA helicase/HKD family nuclease n=1 Tax=Alkalibacillus filiformis TaxID=200990 RepID=A0ABU0DSF8_9BACI|nr:DEAD/DEAH box helicase [Alkalibacillus filiformis]MDQ0351374.1 superfamily II DNA or RNA helicase/HKD family nuclease [Alkalibacillus filiformis]
MLREGIYEEVINKRLKGALSELEQQKFQIGKEPIDQEEASKKLSAYISYITRRALKIVRENEKASDSLIKQIRVCNEIIDYLSRELEEDELKSLQITNEGEILTSLYSKLNSVKSLDHKQKNVRPVTPISESSLFTGAKSEPNMMSELKKEILTSDHIQMLVSFIKWSGLRVIIDELRQFTERGGKLEVITTSYMEATDYKAIDELSQLPNTEVKVSYDTKRTRLHAKAYIFKRETNFSTAYIGSSNLSNPALTSGLEWNVKITEKDSFDVMKKVDATFESYWNDDEFIPFDHRNEEDRDHLKTMLKKSKFQNEEEVTSALFDLKPYHYQKEVLEKLKVEREVHGRYKNLIVAATGVGKTVISAFDYKRFKQENGRPARLLFVAHREEILKQSRDTFRHILKDHNFGELLVGKESPNSLDHLFVSIQSLNSKDLVNKMSSDYYDYIIVDEFHHAAARSYQDLLSHFEPKVLLGLTATPERMDGQSVTTYFDDRIAAEIRLTEAVDRKLLSPFQYFCVTDTVDLSNVKFTRKGYDLNELENLFTHNKVRSLQILKSLYKYVTDVEEVKGLGFCVGVEHAKYMAKVFNESGIDSIALHGGSDDETRESAKRKLLSGEIKFIFVADLYNEGVDLPDVNTVLFLRPTESLTVFLQQLGRGLRLAEGKECLTVLDFIGQAHNNYSFEEKFRALVGRTRHAIRHYVENGFSNLPKGSFIELESQAKDYILQNIKQATNSKTHIIQKLKTYSQETTQPLTLNNFLNFYQMSAYEFYGRNGDRSFARLLVEAGLKENFRYEYEKKVTKRLPYLLHLNSEKLLKFYLRFIEDLEVRNKEEEIMQNMLYYTFYLNQPEKEGFQSISEGILQVLQSPEMKQEVRSILEHNLNHLETTDKQHDLTFDTPLRVHAKYSRDQIMAALEYFNETQRPEFREGVKYFDDKSLDTFFITLNKTEKDFSPSTLYEDYAINEKLFHWQTQSQTSKASETAQRYIYHRQKEHQIALFVREYKQEHGYAAPYTFLGTADYVKHSGEKPIDFVWQLREEMPAYLVPKANKNIL